MAVHHAHDDNKPVMQFEWLGQCLEWQGVDELMNVTPRSDAGLLRTGSGPACLDALARLSLDPKNTAAIFVSFEPLFVDLCNRWLSSPFLSRSRLPKIAAVARLIDVAPHLSVYAHGLANLEDSDELSSLFAKDSTALSALPTETLIELLLSIHRLLRFDERYSFFTNPARIQTLLSHEDRCVRYLSVRIICLFLHASDSITKEMVQKFVGDWKIPGPYEQVEAMDYRFLSLWEQRRVQDLREAMQIAWENRQGWPDSDSDVHAEDPKKVVSPADLARTTACVADCLLPSFGIVPQPLGLVLTPGTTQSISKVASNMNAQKPLLVTGPPGCGKTSTIKAIARTLGKADSMLTLHLNDQTDAKLLLGLYTSAGGPSTFKWQPGVLTTAVTEGRWVLIEDLDRAPNEIASVLLPLLERDELIVPNLGGSVRPAHGFRLFATVRTSLKANGEEAAPSLSHLGHRHWHQVSMQEIPDDDLERICAERFPSVKPLLEMVLQIYRNAARQPSAPSRDLLIKSSRRFGPRDLMRFCARLEAYFKGVPMPAGIKVSSAKATVDVLLDGIDCFAASLSSDRDHHWVAAEISSAINNAEGRGSDCARERIPVYMVRKNVVQAGRETLPIKQSTGRQSLKRVFRPFAPTPWASRVMEAAARTVNMNEPCLLVGETGTGKTTIVQELAHSLNQPLRVVNLSQQSEVGDLLGGFKPVNTRGLVMPTQESFEALFSTTFSELKNEHFLRSLGRAVKKGDWARVLRFWGRATDMARDALAKPAVGKPENPQKRRKLDEAERATLKERWIAFEAKLRALKKQILSKSDGFAFSFVEGTLVKAVRNGDWILLDEINLASQETLESLIELVSNDVRETPSIVLSESGNMQNIQPHPNFRIFAAMNPATDIGKKELPWSLRSRFTELYVRSPDTDTRDLEQIIQAYLNNFVKSDPKAVAAAAASYTSIRQSERENALVDGSGQKPHFSLRTLTRALTFAADTAAQYGLRRALYEGFTMSFLTILDRESATLVQRTALDQLLSKGSHGDARALFHRTPRCPGKEQDYVRFRQCWMPKGPYDVEAQAKYIMTPFVEANLLNLIRAAFTKRYPILLQGPTSSGKTSMVEYLAKISGNRFVRINNHEHTDLQEYLGTYVSGPSGLEFKDGALVRAIREGHWVVLDELNLAPIDVLEALNRLLDDNRELFIPETQEVVQPHPNFVLFATQNPPGMYGGRKSLSRAFRNRFLEIHFDDIPEDELEIILKERTQIAPSYCTKIVAVYKQLAVVRRSERVFEQKNSFATLRDLFRWAFRDADNVQQLADNGFMLLGERVRKDSERQQVKEIIEGIMRVKIDPTLLYAAEKLQAMPVLPSTVAQPNLVWTSSTRRLCTLVLEALKRREPVLLIGGTGTGKSSICQFVARALGRSIQIFNAHQNTETGDLIGAQRPIRQRSLIEQDLKEQLKSVLLDSSSTSKEGDLDHLIAAYRNLGKDARDAIPPERQPAIEKAIARAKSIFEWCDGSLVSAMKNGDVFLLDEISLADDSVLERLNSVLEPSRSIFLAEKGSEDSYVVAAEGFQFLATMNPGGDYGKKELSPALRNRFTEIWVPPLSEEEDIFQITEAALCIPMKPFARSMVEFAIWCRDHLAESGSTLSLRQLLSWVDLVNSYQHADRYFALWHGAALAFIDGLGARPSAQLSTGTGSLALDRTMCLEVLSKTFAHNMKPYNERQLHISESGETFEIGDFEVRKLSGDQDSPRIVFEAPTTKLNLMRIVRALQIQKPILMEGAPGVGKTALIAGLASAVGAPFSRINLSDQTDLMDLFGSDVPTDGEQASHFAWRDGPFLSAMQRGEWVLLDEMNLASQSVLEGLNACLDHRGQVYVPELDQTFTKHPDFKLFAAQNPHSQGDGRKGLPASFVDRFTIVHADKFSADDFLSISQTLYPNISAETVQSMVRLMFEANQIIEKEQGASDTLQTLNLRDFLRWLQLLSSKDPFVQDKKPASFVPALVLYRCQDLGLRSSIKVAAEAAFSSPEAQNQYSIMGRNIHDSYTMVQRSSPDYYQCGQVLHRRDAVLQPSHKHMTGFDTGILESVLLAVQQNWPCLLIGPSAAGKSAIIEHLGTMLGANVVTLSMNPDMDTMDLVGGYEQLDYERHFLRFRNRLREELAAITSLRFSVGYDPGFVSQCLEAMQLSSASQLFKFQTLLDSRDQNEDLLFPESLVAEFHHLMQEKPTSVAGRFEWVDGTVVEAIKRGYWLVIDHANLCNPSVLDRLNSLMEPNGILYLNEHRAADGSGALIRPHQNFRLFLTVDPRHGALSRAMHNRCLELFVHAPSPVSCIKDDALVADSFSSRYECFQWFGTEFEDKAHFQAAMSVCCENLAFGDLQYFTDWAGQVPSGLVNFDREFSKLMGSRGAVLVFFMLTAVFKAISRLYDTYSARFDDLTNRGSLLSAQPICPLNNPQILSLRGDNHARRTALWLSFLFESFMTAAEISCDNMYRHTKNVQYPPPVTVLDQSSLADTDPRYSKQPGPRLYELMRKLFGALCQWLEAQTDQSGDEMADVERVIFFAKDLFHLVDAVELDPLVFDAHLRIGGRLLNRTRSSKRVEELCSSLKSTLTPFQAERSLSCGSCMEAIWTALALPQTHATPMSSTQCLQLRVATADFDRAASIAFRMDGEPVPALREIRQSYLRVCSGLITGTEQDMQVLEGLLSRFHYNGHGNPLRQPHPIFKDEFDCLSQLKALNQRYRYERPMALIGITAGRPSWKNIVSLFSPAWPILLDQITAKPACGIPKTHLALLKQTLPLNVIKKSRCILQAPLGFLDRLSEETSILGRGMCQWSGAITSDVSQSLWDVLRAIQTDLHLSLPSHLGINAKQRLRDAFTGKDATIPPSELFQLEADRFNDQDEDASFMRILRDRLRPSIRQLVAVNKDHPQWMHYIACAWVNLFAGILLLFVPDHPTDPAVVAAVEASAWQKRKKSFEAKLWALEVFEKRAHGRSGSLRCELLRQKLRAFGNKPEVILERSNNADFTSLHVDLLVVLEYVARRCPVLQGPADFNDRVLDELRVIQRHISDLVPRLRDERHKDYFDITSLVVGLLAGLDVGIALVIMTRVSSSRFRTPSRPSIPLLGTSLEEYVELGLVRLEPEAKAHAVLERLGLEVAVTGKSMLANGGIVLWAVHTMYQKWRQCLDRDKEQHAAKNSLYHFKSSHEDQNTEEQEDFQQMFPENSNDAPSEDGKTYGERNNDSPGMLVESAVHLLGAIFKPKESGSGALCDYLRGLALVASDVEPRDEEMFPISVEKMMPLAILELSRAEDKLKSLSIQQGYSYFTDLNIAAGKQLVEQILKRVRAHFERVRVQWPEHATPVSILEAVQDIMDLSISTPIAKLMPMVERLHAHISEWQSIASREVSAADLYSKLTDLIVSWRRSELSSWARLLDVEDEKCKRDSDAWFFIAYETSLAAAWDLRDDEQALERHIEPLLLELQRFLSTSTCGQFPARLALLELLCQLCQLAAQEHPGMKSLVNALRNLYSFNKRYLHSVNEHVQKQRRLLEKDIKEVVLLASWKDTNIQALRQSAKSSHFKLFKMVRKYRALLAEPVEPLMHPNPTQGVEKTAERPTSSRDPSEKTGSGALQPRVDPSAGAASGRNALALTAWGASTNTSDQLAIWQRHQCDLSRHLDSFTLSLKGRVEAFAKSTPSSWTLENDDKIKQLKSFKRKMFADTLKSLRTMGIRHNLDGETLERQAQTHKVLARVSSATVMKESETDFFAFLDNMAAIRKNSNQHSEELTNNEVARSVGLFEGMLLEVLRQREALGCALEEATALDESMDLVSKLCAQVHATVRVRGLDAFDPSKARHWMAWMATKFETSCIILQKHQDLGGVDTYKLRQEFDNSSQALRKMIAALDELPTMPAWLSTSSHRSISVNLQHLTEQLDLQQLHEEWPDVKYLLNALGPSVHAFESGQIYQTLSWTAAYGIELPQAAKPPNWGDGTPEDAWRSTSENLASAVASANASVTRCMHILDGSPKSTHESGWLAGTNESIVEALQSFRKPQVGALVADALNGNKLKHLSDTDFSRLTGLCATSLPVLQKSQEALKLTNQQFQELHAAECRMASALSEIFKSMIHRGFCSPTENSKEEAETGKVESGVGLGEGEGAEDISNDVQEDEDLTDLAEQRESEKNKEEIGNEPDAVDMADNDLEGDFDEGGGSAKDSGSGDEEGGDEVEDAIDTAEGEDSKQKSEQQGKEEEEVNERSKANGKEREKTSEDMAANEQSGDAAKNGDEEGQSERDGSEGEQEDASIEGVERMEVFGEEEEGHPEKQDGQLDLPEDLDMSRRKSPSPESSDDGLEMGSDQDSVEKDDEYTDERMSDTTSDLPRHEEPESDTNDDLKEDNEPAIEDVSEMQDADQDQEMQDLQSSDAPTDPAMDISKGEAMGSGGFQDQDVADDDTQNQGGGQSGHGLQSQQPDEQAKTVGQEGELQQGFANNGQAAPEASQSAAPKQVNDNSQKLGDGSERWHRRREILPAQDSDQKEQSGAENEAPREQDYSHLPDEKATADAQALGPATSELLQGMDRQSVDGDAGSERDDFVPDVEDTPEQDGMELDAQKPHDNRSEGAMLQSGALIGDPGRSLEIAYDSTMDLDEDIPERLSNVHLSSNGTATRPFEDARRLWSHYENVTRDLSLSLAEQLRLILAPTLKSKMRGDFRTGKRLNIKRIIPYIASGYKRDKIWMRRSIATKRNYQVMLAIDDSKSMGESGSSRLAFETLAMMSKSLSLLEVGQICVVSFGGETTVAHPFDRPFTSEAGVNMFRHFTFEQTQTNVQKLVSASLDLFREAKAKQHSSSGSDLWQLQLIISDGICENHRSVQRLVRQAQEEKIMIVFVIVDSMNANTSILDMSSASFEASDGEPSIRVRKYLETFPFNYYLIVRDVKELPSVLAGALRQWMSEVSEA